MRSGPARCRRARLQGEVYERPGSKRDPVVWQSDSSLLSQLPEGDGKAMEKLWFTQAPGTAQRHLDIPKDTNSGTSVLFPHPANIFVFNL